MDVELGDDSMYPMKGVGSISFHIPLGYFLELSDVIFVPILKNNILLVSCIVYVQWRISFEGE
jgi:hypothetical protein